MRRLNGVFNSRLRQAPSLVLSDINATPISPPCDISIITVTEATCTVSLPVLVYTSEAAHEASTTLLSLSRMQQACAADD
jgi:hypothetical protein